MSPACNQKKANPSWQCPATFELELELGLEPLIAGGSTYTHEDVRLRPLEQQGDQGRNLVLFARIIFGETIYGGLSFGNFFLFLFL